MSLLPDFSRRSSLAEIIDDTHLESDVMSDVFGNLETINRFLGGFATTVGALRRLLPDGIGPIRVLDVGAGGGDMAERLIDWGRAQGRRIEIVAVDLSFAASALARRRLGQDSGTSVVQANVMSLPFPPRTFDVVLCALFLHHFSQPDAVHVLRAMLEVSRSGVIVNDLHRHPLAWAGIRILCRLFGAHPIVQHDAAVSVLRGFRRPELVSLAEACRAEHEIRWRWAFRYQLVARPPSV